MPETLEKSFETVIESHLLANGYVAVDRSGFDRERAIFPETVLDAAARLQMLWADAARNLLQGSS
jgi:hypothetical protein